MYVNRTGWKVDTVNTPPVEDSAPAAQDSGDEYIPPLPSQEDEAMESTDRTDDYILGDGRDGVNRPDENAPTTEKLDNWPPTLEEILMRNPDVIENLDILLKKIEDWQAYVEKLIASSSGNLQTKLKEAQARLAILKAETEALNKKNQNLYEMELWTGKDLNNDGWQGERGAPGSLIIQYNKKGEIVRIDPVTNKAVPNYMKLPSDFKPKFLDNVNVITDKSQIPGSFAKDEDYTISFQLTEAALTTPSPDSKFAAPINFTIPPVVWVKGDGKGPTLDKNGDIEPFMEFEGGIQKNPAGPGYIQMPVTRVEIYSVENGLKDARGNPLFRHVIKLYNEETEIMSMSIDGLKVANSIPAATATDEGFYYVAASTLGFEVNGTYLTSSIELDMTRFISTGRHKDPNLLATLDSMGVKRPGDGGRGDRAFDANINAFSDAPGVEYGQYNDVYVAVNDDTVNKTAAYVHKVSGDLRLTAYDDLIVGRGPNEKTQFMSENMPPNQTKVEKDDPYYSNIVDAGDGTNFGVFRGGGDNYLIDFTGVDADSSNSEDELYFAPQQATKKWNGTKHETVDSNPAIYLHARGGKIYVDNTDDELDASLAAKDDEGQFTTEYTARQNDYFDAVGLYADPDDDEEIKSAHMGDGMVRDDIIKFAEEARAKLGEAINKLPDVDEAKIEAAKKKVKTSSELESEMNSFFDEYSLERDSIEGEREVEDEDIPETI